ncbi:MAG: hypothetical protein WEB09_10770 [Nitriliruptor sp.]
MTEPRPEGDPDFGPGGYLPERAAKRARKIVLRAPLGVQWIVASLLAGVVVVVAGVVLLTRGGDAPGPPFVAVGPVEQVAGQVVHDGDLDVLLVGLGGRIRAFDAPADVTYCEASRRLESPDGEVWSLTGRGTGGVDSFAEHPTVTSGGVLYVDLSAATTPPTPSDDEVTPGCS